RLAAARPSRRPPRAARSLHPHFSAVAGAAFERRSCFGGPECGSQPRERMRALTYQAPYKVKVGRKKDPEIEHPNDVVLRVTRAAICGSDLHLLHGLVPDTRVGSTFGHEFTGVVEEVGPSVRSLVKGDRVVVPFNISCGSCF